VPEYTTQSAAWAAMPCMRQAGPLDCMCLPSPEATRDQEYLHAPGLQGSNQVLHTLYVNKRPKA